MSNKIMYQRYKSKISWGSKASSEELVEQMDGVGILNVDFPKFPVDLSDLCKCSWIAQKYTFPFK